MHLSRALQREGPGKQRLVRAVTAHGPRWVPRHGGIKDSIVAKHHATDEVEEKVEDIEETAAVDETFKLAAVPLAVTMLMTDMRFCEERSG
jgi:hypothetical protein